MINLFIYEIKVFRQQESFMSLNNAKYESFGYGEIKKQNNGWHSSLKDNFSGKTLHIRANGGAELLHHGPDIPIIKCENGRLIKINDVNIIKYFEK
jgi:hypothetical protein